MTRASSHEHLKFGIGCNNASIAPIKLLLQLAHSPSMPNSLLMLLCGACSALGEATAATIGAAVTYQSIAAAKPSTFL